MAISAPCSWKNSRLEACPRASAPPGCHGRTVVSWCRRASMVLRDCSCLSRHLFVDIILPGTSGKIHLVGLSCLYLSSDAPADVQPLASTTRERRLSNGGVDAAARIEAPSAALHPSSFILHPCFCSRRSRPTSS